MRKLIFAWSGTAKSWKAIQNAQEDMEACRMSPECPCDDCRGYENEWADRI